MTCTHNLEVTDRHGEGCYVCRDNRNMIQSAFNTVSQYVGRRVRISGPMGGERIVTIRAIAWGRGGADTAVVTIRTAHGEVKHLVGFDIAFAFYGFHVALATSR
jgi:hypothetical protein